MCTHINIYVCVQKVLIPMHAYNFNMLCVWSPYTGEKKGGFFTTARSPILPQGSYRHIDLTLNLPSLPSLYHPTILSQTHRPPSEPGNQTKSALAQDMQGNHTHAHTHTERWDHKD